MVEAIPGRKLLVAVRRGEQESTDIAVVDSQSGAIDRIERAARLTGPALTIPMYFTDPRAPIPTPQPVIWSSGALWRWNVATGAKTKILG